MNTYLDGTPITGRPSIITTDDGIRLAVREYGPRTAPLTTHSRDIAGQPISEHVEVGA